MLYYVNDKKSRCIKDIYARNTKGEQEIFNVVTFNLIVIISKLLLIVNIIPPRGGTRNKSPHNAYQVGCKAIFNIFYMYLMLARYSGRFKRRP